MWPSPSNNPTIISLKGLSIVNFDLWSFESLFVVGIVEKFCVHTKLIEVIRSLIPFFVLGRKKKGQYYILHIIFQ